MEIASARAAVAAASAASSFDLFGTEDWIELAIELLIAGVEFESVVELASLPPGATASDADPVLRRVIGDLEVPQPDDVDAVAALASVLSRDLRQHPGPVTFPMIRVLAELVPRGAISPMAHECFGAAEYLDCDCRSDIDNETLERRLESMSSADLPDTVATLIATRLRILAPSQQPRHDH
jgi:hypothetical protein